MKSRLRHPITSIREPFGTAGLIVAMIALVAALGGTALAAAKLNSTQKKEVEKIAKKFAGKPGANGTNGSNGAAGAKGDAGAAGAAGAVGKEGPQGIQGKPGTNGKNGNPWTLGGTLPASTEAGCPCTETGVWEMGPIPEGGEGFAKAVVSFPIPLPAPIAASNVHIFRGTTIPTGCSGTVAGENVTELKATPGNFCAWIMPFASSKLTTATVGAFDVENENEPGIGTHGAILSGGFLAELEEGLGTWAVTAP